AEPRREAPARTEAPKAADRSGGWLSDLLARASTEEQTDQPMRPAQRRTPAPTALDNLDALSSDIARMVDHEAVADLWDRWRRGERNVFSRRLYTTQGQQTFDELRRRYRRDVEFRATVDRYVDEFQRLLADVDRNDRDGSLAKSYLTSETGKVFTLLAHASGRFD
ncbi:MAG: kinesin, partial [Phreatobacter sp.]